MNSDSNPNAVADSTSFPLRVCSFESRKQDEMRSLIERNGGVPTIAASMREVPLENNVAVFEFLDRLLAGQFDAVIFMTGVGARALLEVVETKLERAAFFVRELGTGAHVDAGCCRYAHAIIQIPAINIGSDNHCPIDRPSESKPRKSSGSRKYSTKNRNSP